jgi:hypothetical protein
MRRYSALVLATIMTALVAKPASAAKPGADETIVVTGVPMGAEEARALSLDHVRKMLGQPIAGQNARWYEPLCLSVAGIAPTSAVPILQRVEAVATKVGPGVASRGCVPNVVILFTSDADATLAAIEGRRSDLLSHSYASDRQKLRTPGRPVRWFYSHRLEGASGRQIGRETPALVNAVGAIPIGVPIISNEYPGRVVSAARITITDAVVLVDVPRAAGVSLTALADHIAFAVLSRTPLDAQPPADGIMALFQQADGARLAEMTELDAAFLKALYAVPINHVAAAHRSLLADKMVQLMSTPSR